VSVPRRAALVASVLVASVFVVAWCPSPGAIAPTGRDAEATPPGRWLIVRRGSVIRGDGSIDQKLPPTTAANSTAVSEPIT
jgi:hypothetical protein